MNSTQEIQTQLKRIPELFSKLSLSAKIYLSLTLILIPIFTLSIFIQAKVTRPLLEEEVKQIGISICRALAIDINAQQFLAKPERLEARLIELTWQEPSVVRIAVLVKDTVRENGLYVEKVKTLASNIDDDSVYSLEQFNFSPEIAALAAPKTTLQKEDGRSYWEIIYPVQNKNRNRVLAYIKTEISMQLVEQVTGLFARISTLAAVVALGLLIWILSFFLKRMIENEKRLQVAEIQNVELTQQLDEAQRQVFLNEKLAIMGQLTASFAHEIGTPLNSLSGHLQLLAEEIHEKDKNQKDNQRISIINSQVNRIEGIVKEFLASTHMPQKQKQLIELRELIERIVSLVTPRLNAIKVQTQISIENEVSVIRAVPSDIEQLLINLLNNALDALEDSNKVEKSLRIQVVKSKTSKEPQLELHVIDTGPGIKPEDLKQVSKPFYTTKAPGKGTGLGLSICQKIAKKYGGRIDIDSELGKGTNVTVRMNYDPA